MTTYTDPEVLIRDLVGYLRVNPNADIVPTNMLPGQRVGYRDQATEHIQWDIRISRLRDDQGTVTGIWRTTLMRRDAIETFRRMAREWTERWTGLVTDTEELQRVAEAAAGVPTDRPAEEKIEGPSRWDVLNEDDPV